MPTEVELAITVAIMVAEIAILLFCYQRSKQPPDPLKPRLINYPLIMILISLLIIATLAHIVSLLTGNQVQPRRRRGM